MSIAAFLLVAALGLVGGLVAVIAGATIWDYLDHRRRHRRGAP